VRPDEERAGHNRDKFDLLTHKAKKAWCCLGKSGTIRMTKDVFISFSTHDKIIAEKLCAVFEQLGLDCWIAPRNIPPGADFDVAILDGIDQCQAFLLVLSSDANDSPYVKNEVNRAFSRGKPMLTFRIEDIMPVKSLEFYLARHQWTDGFLPPLEDRIARVASALLELLGRSAKQEDVAKPVPANSAEPTTAPVSLPATASCAEFEMARPLVAIVEDERDTATLLSETCQNFFGTKPVIFFEGRPAIPWARKHLPDVIVLDILLPDTDGFSICETLKMERATNTIYVLVESALSGQTDQLRGFERGANMYLTKPFTLVDFKGGLDEAMVWQQQIKRFGRKGRIRFSLADQPSYTKELNAFRSALFIHTHLPDRDVKVLTHTIREMAVSALERSYSSLKRSDMGVCTRASGPEEQEDLVVDYFIAPQTLTMVVRTPLLGFGQSGFAPNAQTSDLKSIDEITFDEVGREVRLIKHLPQ
jgi:CheY-like chemotaxis protein